MRVSVPTPRRTAWMSAPVAWHRRESSFMNETRIASIVFGGVLGELARARIGHDDALARELQRRVERAQHLARLLAPRAEDDAIGPEEVLNGRALLEKLGVRDDLERDAGLRCASARACTASHVPTGTVLLTTTSAGFFAMAGDALGDREHRAHVGRAVGAGRRPDGDEVGVGLVERRARPRSTKRRRPARSLRRTRSARPGS